MNLFVAQYSAQIRNIRVPENMVRILEIFFQNIDISLNEVIGNR